MILWKLQIEVHTRIDGDESDFGERWPIKGYHVAAETMNEALEAAEKKLTTDGFWCDDVKVSPSKYDSFEVGVSAAEKVAFIDVMAES